MALAAVEGGIACASLQRAHALSLVMGELCVS